MFVVVAPMGCLDEGASSAQAICVLIDVSGTYADQKHEVVKVIKRDVLPSMSPGDTVDPDIFRQRIAGWQTRFEQSGGQGWRTIMDPSKLPALLDEIRS